MSDTKKDEKVKVTVEVETEDSDSKKDDDSTNEGSETSKKQQLNG